MRTSCGRNAALAAAILVMALARCTGIETTNGVTVIASSSSIRGNVTSQAKVSLFDTAFIPFIDRGISRTMVTDESGDFAFDGLPRGIYNVIVAASNERDAAFVPCVKIDSSVIDSRYRAMLEPVGSVSGSIADVPDTIAEVLIYLEGTGYYARMPGNGAFVIDRVPAGSYSLRLSKSSFLDTLLDRGQNYKKNNVPLTVSSSESVNTGTLILQP